MRPLSPLQGIVFEGCADRACHARQHLWSVAALLHPHDPAAKKLWMIPRKDLLDDGHIEPLVVRLREIAAESPKWPHCPRRFLRTLVALGSFTGNVPRAASQSDRLSDLSGPATDRVTGIHGGA